MHTPWGPAQNQEQIAPGIVEVDTAGHGGIKVSPPLNARIHRVWRTADGWYEEDCDWAIVALTFPQHFPEQRAARAHDCAKRWHAKSYAVAMGVETRQDVAVGDCPTCGRSVQWYKGWTSFGCSGSDCDAKVPLHDVVLIHHADGTTTTEEPDAPEQDGPALLDLDMAGVADAVQQALAALTETAPAIAPLPQVGDMVRTWGELEPVEYGGPDPHGSSYVLVVGGKNTKVLCPPKSVAPADVPLADATDPRINVFKGRGLASWQGWCLETPDGRTSWHERKRDAVAQARVQLAILDWHVIRAAACPENAEVLALAG